MATPTKKATVAILSKQENLAAALQAVLTPRLPGAKFVNVTKMSDLPEGENVVLASLGMPSYVSTDRVSDLMCIPTSYVEDADERKAQWDMIRDPESSVEDIIEVLGNPDRYKVIPNKKCLAVKHQFAELRLEAAESKPEGDTVEEQLEHFKALYENAIEQRDCVIKASALPKVA